MFDGGVKRDLDKIEGTGPSQTVRISEWKVDRGQAVYDIKVG